MESFLPGRYRAVLTAFVLSTAAFFGSAVTASAVQTHQYDPFLNTPACPVDNPAFSDLICVSTTMHARSIAMGKLKTEATSPTRVSFAFSPKDQDPSCPTECFNAAPGTTVVEDTPVDIDWAKSLFTKLHVPWPAQLGPLAKVFSVTASMEATEDVHAFVPLIDPEGPPTPQLTLPVRIHLQGKLLGRDCYIGSAQKPIGISLFPTAAPSFSFAGDPNGFPVSMINVQNVNFVDPIFAAPAAQGCGPAIGLGKHKIYLLDGLINSLLGLPSPSGKNLLTLSGGETTVAVSEGGSGVMKAAFAAAQQP